MVRAIVPGEIVEINVAGPQMAEHVRARLMCAGVTDLDRVRFRGISTDDAWVRDHGGIFVEEGTRRGREERVVLDFVYDAWGGKYPPWDQDARVAEQMAQILRVRREVSPWVLEGGSIDGDGEGTIFPIYSVYLYTLSYTFIWLYIPPNTSKYRYIPSYTIIYFKISNITKMRPNMRPKNSHHSSPRASPKTRIWHAPSYYIPRGFAMPKGAQF